jgi:hypothetical protein
MTGETDLPTLLATLDPHLAPGRWRFVTGAAAPADALMTFREAEGVTAIIPAAAADPDAFRLITLRVHSSLHAVGLTAAVSARLTAIGVPANIVAAFHHDHLFVPEADAERALAALRDLSRAPPLETPRSAP